MTTLRPTLPLSVYAAATRLASPFAPNLLRSRAARGKEVEARLHERLGRPTRARPGGALVWLHAVSVGEALSLLPLVDALHARRPDIALLVTSGTTTSADLLATRLPERAIHQFAPVDTPGAVHGFLRHWRPHTGVFVESELWPNLIAAAARQGVRLALLSARMTDASARGWARLPATARSLLGAFDLVLPQDADTEGRLTALGASPAGRLNLKLAAPPLPADQGELDRLRAALGSRRAVLAVSTHPGDEVLVGQALIAAGIDPQPLLIAIPRHPGRGPDVAADLAGLGFAVARRAAGEPLAPGATAYVADTLGELGLFLRLGQVAVMGGAFSEGVGGHNPLEPARFGLPVITGPHAFNAREVYGEMLDEAAAIEAADVPALARHLRGLSDNPQIARRTGDAALAYAQRQGQALDRALDLLAPLLPA